jgi:hypothetical protein
MENVFGFLIFAAFVGGVGYFVVWPKLKKKFAEQDKDDEVQPEPKHPKPEKNRDA